MKEPSDDMGILAGGHDLATLVLVLLAARQLQQRGRLGAMGEEPDEP